MDYDFGVVAWFFYGSGTVWLSVVLCFAVMAICYWLNRVYMLIGASVLAIFLMIVGVAGGVYNVSRMEHCEFCGRILPPEYIYKLCPDHLNWPNRSAKNYSDTEESNTWQTNTPLKTISAKQTDDASASKYPRKPFTTLNRWQQQMVGHLMNWGAS